MPDDLISLNKAQVKRIRERISQEGVETPELLEDLLDHFCVAIEEEMKEGRTFESALEHVFHGLEEDELKTTEMKTQEFTEGKKIFYPDLLQSFLMVLAIFLISWVVSLTVQAIMIGEQNVEARAQWLNQNYLWILQVSNMIMIGLPIGYAIWEKRKTRVNAAVFSFRAVPPYVYGAISLILVFSWFWLEPLSIFFPFQEVREAYISKLENFNPLLLTLLTIFNLILGELLFRGIILKGLLMTMTPLRAIFWSSLFYALINYPNFAVMFIVGIMHGWLYWKTRSLYPLIFLIVTGYVLRYVAMLFMDHPKAFFFHFSWWELVEQNLLIYIPLLSVSLLITTALFYYLHRKLSAAPLS